MLVAAVDCDSWRVGSYERSMRIKCCKSQLWDNLSTCALQKLQAARVTLVVGAGSINAWSTTAAKDIMSTSINGGTSWFPLRIVMLEIIEGSPIYGYIHSQNSITNHWLCCLLRLDSLAWNWTLAGIRVAACHLLEHWGLPGAVENLRCRERNPSKTL